MAAYAFIVEPCPPFEPPAEVVWTETGQMYHRRRGGGPQKTFCGFDIVGATGPEKIDHRRDAPLPSVLPGPVGAGRKTCLRPGGSKVARPRRPFLHLTSGSVNRGRGLRAVGATR